MPDTAAAFGRRNQRPPAARSAPRATKGPHGVTPTTLRGVLLAAFGVLCLQMVVLQARSLWAGAADVALAPDTAAALSAPPESFVYGLVAVFATLALGAAHIGAVYALSAHALMRWLKLSSVAGYAMAGFGIVYLFLAIGTLDGDHLQFRASLIELAAGVLSGALYRLASGVVATEPRDAGSNA